MSVSNAELVGLAVDAANQRDLTTVARIGSYMNSTDAFKAVGLPE